MVNILNEKIEHYRDDMVRDLQGLIQKKSVLSEAEGEFPFGSDIQAAYEFVLELAKGMGFECRNFDNYAGDISMGTKPFVGAALHTDVVPEGDGWTVDPYKGEIINGKIYGRGATDNKGSIIAILYAMKALKESGLNLSKGIRMIVGNNEEGGIFPCIKHYMECTELPESGLVPDAVFPAVFAEKNFLTISLKKKFNILRPLQETKLPVLIKAEGGTAANVVPPSASAQFSIDNKEGATKVAFEGKSAHASKPELGVNAVSNMLKFLEHMEYEPKEVCDFIKELSMKIAYDTEGRGLGVDCVDDSGALTNNVAIFTYSNDELEVCMNMRCPLGEDREVLEAKLRESASKLDMEYSTVGYNPGFYVNKKDETLNKLLDVYRSMTGDCESELVAHGSGSYARVMKGFIPFGPIMPGEEITFHQPNENISIDKLVEVTKIYAQALYELAK